MLEQITKTLTRSNVSVPFTKDKTHRMVDFTALSPQQLDYLAFHGLKQLVNDTFSSWAAKAGDKMEVLQAAIDAREAVIDQVTRNAWVPSDFKPRKPAAPPKVWDTVLAGFDFDIHLVESIIKYGKALLGKKSIKPETYPAHGWKVLVEKLAVNDAVLKYAELLRQAEAMGADIDL